MASRQSEIGLVRQVDSTGCGIAVVAMIAGVSYQAAKEAIFPNWRRKRGFATTAKELRLGLERLGYSAADRLRPARPNWRDLPELAIAKVRYPWQSEYEGHWVLWFATTDGGRVFCPEGQKPYKRYPYRPLSAIRIFK